MSSPSGAAARASKASGGEAPINTLTRGYVEPEAGFEPATFRLRVGFSTSTWSATDGSGQLTLDGPSLQMAPDGYRRIVWMIIGMIKRIRWRLGWQSKKFRHLGGHTLGQTPGLPRSASWARCDTYNTR
jgi:hypothetical protein